MLNSFRELGVIAKANTKEDLESSMKEHVGVIAAIKRDPDNQESVRPVILPSTPRLSVFTGSNSCMETEAGYDTEV